MTETKAGYKTSFAVAYTLDDLEALKVEYLHEGENLFDRLALIVAALGSSITIGHRNYLIWQRDNITALFSSRQERYLPGKGRYQETQTLSIFLNCPTVRDIEKPDRLQVCYLKRDPFTSKMADDPDARFVPGKWTDEMLSYLAAAKQIVSQQWDEITEAKRLALMKELLIGTEI